MRRVNCPEDIWKCIEIRGPDECWPWKGCTNKGYGLMGIRREKRRVHRLAYETRKGLLPEHLQVQHTCNNTICCNPVHLVLGNAQSNNRYAAVCNRRKPGASRMRGVCLKRVDYWIAYTDRVQGDQRTLYSGYNFFEACCARKSWEAKRQPNGGAD